MIGNLYTEEEVKQLFKELLPSSAYGNDEIFNHWFDKHKKPENCELEAIELKFSKYNSEFIETLNASRNEVFKINNNEYLIDSIKENDGFPFRTININIGKKY